jgi:hypothetical protein
LLVNRKLRITHNVDEQDMRDLQLDFLFNLSLHTDSPRNQITDILAIMLSTVESRDALEYQKGRPLVISSKGRKTKRICCPIVEETH